MLSPLLFDFFITVILFTFLYSLFEYEISVKFYVIDVIFDEKLVIGENVDFLRILYLYRNKVVWIVILNWGVEWVKVLILVGFTILGAILGFGV